MLRVSCKKFLGLGVQQQQPNSLKPFQSLVRFYHERVVDHYDNPRNVGSFDKNDPTVGTGLVGAPACGDVMKLQIKVDDSATEWVKGKQMEEVLTIRNTEIAKHLSLPPVKLHCSMLAEDAIKAAVKDYEAKRAKTVTSDSATPAEKTAQA
ncbi:hypothetical protein AQUCO_00200132v1 [Aquilegia coerulea]|uniref:NIF system FeS cluster assembly NifU N-terminal domain-containing protein n=1 Tax=Aquilegia coerulea TaxID=218851 RepID=A0A2G5F1T5_AQUCA|nr:hypothetical protein AQUCO_00200132v1 [Aquilegia coerulea]